MKKSDPAEANYAERQSDRWVQVSKQWINRQAEQFDAEMKRQKTMGPLPTKLEFEKELRNQLSSADIAQISDSEYKIYQAQVRERVRRKFLGARIDPTYKLGKSGGYQPTAMP
jgi:hypothetical protein